MSAKAFPAAVTRLVRTWERLRWGAVLFRHLWREQSLSEFLFFRIMALARRGATDRGTKFWLVEDTVPAGEMAALCDIYGSDKGEAQPGPHPYPWPSHNYVDLYTFFLESRREHIRTVLECGIGTNNPNIPSNMSPSGIPGASLRVWRDYFPNATVFGVDIDSDIFFSEERIRTAYVDQLDPLSFQNFLRDNEYPEFDVIIDDGLHTFDASRTFFESAFTSLSNDGLYFIEDCDDAMVDAFRTYFFDKRHLSVRFFSLFKASAPAVGDNTVIVVKRQ